jgi:hypothetical protein
MITSSVVCRQEIDDFRSFSYVHVVLIINNEKKR